MTIIYNDRELGEFEPIVLWVGVEYGHFHNNGASFLITRQKYIKNFIDGEKCLIFQLDKNISVRADEIWWMPEKEFKNLNKEGN